MSVAEANVTPGHLGNHCFVCLHEVENRGTDSLFGPSQHSFRLHPSHRWCELMNPGRREYGFVVMWY